MSESFCMSQEQLKQQIYIGYVSSVLIALFFAGVAADGVWMLFEALKIQLPVEQTKSMLICALFFAFCFANPVGAYLLGKAIHVPLRNALVGAIFGAFFCHYLVEPIIGSGLMRISLLVVACSFLPLMSIRDHFFAKFRKCWEEHGGFSKGASCFEGPVLARILFIFGLVAGIAIAWTAAPDIESAALALVIVVCCHSLLLLFFGQTTDPEIDVRPLPFFALPSGLVAGFTIWLGALLTAFMSPQVSERFGMPEGFGHGLIVALTGLCVLFVAGAAAIAVGSLLVGVVGHYARWPSKRVNSMRWRLAQDLALHPLRRKDS